VSEEEENTHKTLNNALTTMYKRQQRVAFDFGSSNNAQQNDPHRERLQTLGMRIRQSVSNGYQVPHQVTNSNSYMNQYEQQQQQINSLNNFKRVPLPAHLAMDGPPALDYNGSTASSLAGWEDEVNNHTISVNLNSLNSSTGIKRGFSDVNDVKEMQMEDYVQRYGPLTFNEEF